MFTRILAPQRTLARVALHAFPRKRSSPGLGRTGEAQRHHRLVAADGAEQRRLVPPQPFGAATALGIREVCLLRTQGAQVSPKQKRPAHVVVSQSLQVR